MSPNDQKSFQVQPEEMSLQAHQHIQDCLTHIQRSTLSKDDVTAILRLAQHLRVFGLLSAVGYLNQAKDGKVQERTKPMWLPLLWRLVFAQQPLGEPQALMQEVQSMAKAKPRLYMVTWRKAIVFSNHWNFWAKAYQEEKANDSTEHSASIG
jgi:ribosomal protein S8